MRYQYAINTLSMNCDPIACHPQIASMLNMVSIRYRYATNMCYQYALNMLRLPAYAFNNMLSPAICYEYAANATDTLPYSTTVLSILWVQMHY